MSLAAAKPSTSETRAVVLAQSLDYITRFRGSRIVVKVGGAALEDPRYTEDVISDIFMMHAVGMKPIVVHGGGPQITEMMGRLGLKTSFKDGHRVTDQASLDVTRMVLVGKVNRDLVTGINRRGRVALGLSGEDLGLLTVEPRDPDLGYVGDVTDVNTSLIERLLADDLIPVVATIGSDVNGSAYNVNADMGASAIAVALSAEKIIYLTDVDGVLSDPTDPESLVGHASLIQVDELMNSGAISDGMLPKIEGSAKAVSGGVGSAHILNGSTRHALLVELLTNTGVGTMITKDET